MITANDAVMQDLRIFFNHWHEYGAIYEEYAKKIGISSSSLDVLIVLNEEPTECTQKVLSHATFLPKQTINSIVTSFLHQGLVSLTESQTDRRFKNICLTAAGKTYATKTVQPILAAEHATMAGLPAEQRQKMLGIMARYLVEFKNKVRQI
ncbi:MarR family winged helix-turn-helix transcriptional regulator [Lapidilactobacillus bayanensis]|uniref:MarR family winged helix-turn-helix transcriptional regulator n=1 Tax=Lapidilactobacillus bayanensis TaxID=2485998 RepID=UPI0013DE140F|nr:MarR family winged helix-turn-helix transcriptional regulator [Lapidilactobacillus bayanensis]